MSEKNENERLVVEEDDSDSQSSSMEGKYRVDAFIFV